ncbi:hypothetical protein FRZ00_13810 [Streptomyces mobaraensis]|uniref:Uncharacterized protein n=1 Tax=Streptomyces mobaraensis TaxID=35621 RepID=A0A5N5W8J7_STRMB|nr:hypothetical protein FRZ00_13810 [Streptomyces mobaraensis]
MAGRRVAVAPGWRAARSRVAGPSACGVRWCAGPRACRSAGPSDAPRFAGCPVCFAGCPVCRVSRVPGGGARAALRAPAVVGAFPARSAVAFSGPVRRRPCPVVRQPACCRRTSLS